METEKRKKWIVNFLYFAIILGIVIWLCRFALPAMLPFVIAFVVALLLKPVIRFLREKCHVHKSVAGVVIVLLFYALIGFLLAVLGIKLFSACKAFFLTLPSVYVHNVQPWIDSVFNAIEALAARVNPESTATYDAIAANITQTLGETVSTLSRSAVGWVTTFTFKTPGMLLDVLITIIATVFIAVDWSVLSEFVMRQFSDKTRNMIGNVRTHLGLTLGRYIRSYALILTITFVELSIGLSIVGVENPLAISAVIALFDILPVVGSGTVLIPWALIALIRANYMRALGLGIVYIVIVVIRNIIEPKIIGKRVGLHPIVTLTSMVVGTYVFGPIGLLGLPVTLALLQSLNEDGVIHLFKRKPPAEEPAPEPVDAPNEVPSSTAEDAADIGE